MKFSYCLVKFPSLTLILQKVNFFYTYLMEHWRKSFQAVEQVNKLSFP